MASNLKELKATWTGIRPLLMHNGLMCDHLNPVVTANNTNTAKKSKMTEADRAEVERLEWNGSLYLYQLPNRQGLHIPTANIESCIKNAAKKTRRGKDVEAAMLVQNEVVVLNYSGPTNLDQMYDALKFPDDPQHPQHGEPLFALRVPIVVQKAHVMRRRPLIPTGWSISFTLEYDDTVINRYDLIETMHTAGSLVGLGDWRPKFGRFLVEIEK